MDESFASIGRDVSEFYRQMPFNTTESPERMAELIKQKNSVQDIYPAVEDFYEADTFLEMGCGTGWLSNTIAYYFGLNVTAVDFNPIAIGVAKECAKTLGVDVDFRCADLFQYQCEPKDIVVSNGVLHHTSDTRGGVLKCASLTKSGGKIFIGLYHKYGRMPFLNYFNEMKENGADEDALFEKYRELHKKYADDVQVRSWFLDQVLHPYESQHTLQEMVPIFREADVKLISTSINGFEPVDDLERLYDLEKKLYDRGMQYLKEKKYYPGFFYILGQKN